MYPSPHPKYPLSASKIELSGKNAGFWVSEAEISIFPLKMSGFAVKSPTSDLEYRGSDLGGCQSDLEISASDGGGGISGVPFWKLLWRMSQWWDYLFFLHVMENFSDKVFR